MRRDVAHRPLEEHQVHPGGGRRTRRASSNSRLSEAESRSTRTLSRRGEEVADEAERENGRCRRRRRQTWAGWSRIAGSARRRQYLVLRLVGTQPREGERRPHHLGLRSRRPCIDGRSPRRLHRSASTAVGRKAAALGVEERDEGDRAAPGRNVGEVAATIDLNDVLSGKGQQNRARIDDRERARLRVHRANVLHGRGFIVSFLRS